MLACVEGGARRGADGCGAEPLCQDRAVGSHGVDVWRADGGVPVATEVVRPQIIGNYDGKVHSLGNQAYMEWG